MALTTTSEGYLGHRVQYWEPTGEKTKTGRDMYKPKSIFTKRDMNKYDEVWQSAIEDQLRPLAHARKERKVLHALDAQKIAFWTERFANPSAYAEWGEA